MKLLDWFFNYYFAWFWIFECLVYCACFQLAVQMNLNAGMDTVFLGNGGVIEFIIVMINQMKKIVLMPSVSISVKVKFGFKTIKLCI